MKTLHGFASVLALCGASAALGQAPAAAPALPPEVEAAIKAQADSLNSTRGGAAAPARGAPVAARGAPPAIASGKAGENFVVSVLNISENRSASGTGAGIGSVNLNVSLSGAGVVPGTIIKQITVSKAADDAGRTMVPNAARGASPLNIVQLNMNSRLASMFRGGAAPNVTSTMNLGGTGRDAKAIASVDGQIEIYTPSETNGSMALVKNIRARAGKPLDDEALAKNGIEFVLLTAETLATYQERTGAVGGTASSAPNGIQAYVRDPGGKLIGYVVLDEAGQPGSVGPSGAIGRGDGGMIVTAQFNPRGGPPGDIQIAFFLATPESTKSIPFHIENIPLP